MVLKSKETAVSAIGSMFADVKTDNAFGGGLGVKVTRLSAGLASLFDGVDYCHNVLTRARIAVLARMSKGGLGGLHSTRRLIATSRFDRGFSFGVNRNGIIAPVPNYGLMSHGKPSGLSLPCGRSANPCGVSHLLGGWWGTSYKLTQGIKAMMLTLSSSVSTAFPSVPEPIYKPVTSATAGSSEPVSYDVTSDVNAIVELLANEYNSTINDSSVYGRFRFNVVRGVAVEILRACDEALGRAYTPSSVIGG